MEYLLIKLECLLRKLWFCLTRQIYFKNLKKIVMWLSAIKLAVNDSHIYKRKKKRKCVWRTHKCLIRKRWPKWIKYSENY